MQLVYKCILVLFVKGMVAAGFPEYIPVGSIFDHYSVQTQTAYKYALTRYNHKRSSQFQIEAVVNVVNISDSYTLNATLCRQLSRGVFFIFAVFPRSSESSLNTMSSLAEAIQMPYAIPTTVPSLFGYPETQFQINLAPPYLDAMIDVIKKYGWKNVHYLYSNDEGLIRIHYMNKAMKNYSRHIQIIAHRLPSLQNVHRTLRNVDKWDKEKVKVIAIDIEKTQEMQLLLTQITEVGMNRRGYHYLIGGVGIRELDLESFRHGGVNITGFSLLNSSRDEFKTFSKEWGKLDAAYWHGAGDTQIQYEAALMVDAVELFARAMNYMKIKDDKVFRETFRRGRIFNNGSVGIKCSVDPPDPWRHGKDIMQAITADEVQFDGLSGRVRIGSDGKRRDYVLDIIEVSLNRGPEWAGSWSSTNGLSNYKDQAAVMEQTEPFVKMKKLLVTTLVNPPYVMKKLQNRDTGNLTGNDRFEGYCIDMMKTIARDCGFEYQLHEVEDGQHGVLVNGTWNGLIGELVSEKADIALGDLTINSLRERAVDFSKPFMTLGISIMIMTPQKQKPSVSSFMDPLDSRVWICIMCAYVGVSLVLFIVCKYSPYETSNDFTLYNSLWFSLGCFMQQGADIAPSSISGRIAGGVWWICSLILIASYTANLAAFLTVEQLIVPVKSADDLTTQKVIQYGTVNGGSTKSFFENSDDIVYNKMWKKMSEDDSVFVESVKKGVERVRTSKGKYAFLLDSPTNEYHNQKLPCNTMKVGSNLDSKGFGVATRSGNDLKNKITVSILKMLESGELTKLKNRWWYDKGECGQPDSDKKGSQKNPLSLSNVSGIFYILFGGLGLSIVVSLVDIVFKSKKEAKSKKTTFKNALKRRARLSIHETNDRENYGVAGKYNAEPLLDITEASYPPPGDHHRSSPSCNRVNRSY